MSRFFDLVSKPAREMSAPHIQTIPRPAPEPRSIVKLDSNENPFGPSPGAVDAMRTSLSSSNFYPDDDCGALRLKLAGFHGLPADQVLVTAGSTGMLSLLCQTLLAPGLNAVTSERSFIVYAMAVHAAGAQLIEVPMQQDTFDLPALLTAIDSNTRLVFLANPNNPTGTALSPDAIEQFLSRIPPHVVVVLDEAYYEFALHFAALRRVNYSNSLDYVQKGLSVVVLRTFSKAHGLAGLRVGYGLGPAELLGYCSRMRSTYSVASTAQTAAMAALDDQEHIQRVVESNAVQARFLAQELEALGYRIAPTWANFLYCDLGQDSMPFANQLREEGVVVRPLGAWGAPNCIRVTIGTPAQSTAFLKAIRHLTASNSSHLNQPRRNLG